MPTSNPLPRLGRLAGDRPTVIRRCGHCSRLFTIAARIRSPRLTQGGIRQAHQQQPWEPVLDVGLDFDRMTLHPDQRDRVGAGDGHSAHPPHVLEGELP